MQDYESERNDFQGTPGHKNLISPASETQFKCRNTRARAEKAFLGHRRTQNLKPLMIPTRSEHPVAMIRPTTLHAYRGDDLLKIIRKNQGDWWQTQPQVQQTHSIRVHISYLFDPNRWRVKQWSLWSKFCKSQMRNRKALNQRNKSKSTEVRGLAETPKEHKTLAQCFRKQRSAAQPGSREASVHNPNCGPTQSAPFPLRYCTLVPK